jgi:hypothetical protein
MIISENINFAIKNLKHRFYFYKFIEFLKLHKYREIIQIKKSDFLRFCNCTTSGNNYKKLNQFISYFSKQFFFKKLHTPGKIYSDIKFPVINSWRGDKLCVDNWFIKLNTGKTWNIHLPLKLIEQFRKSNLTLNTLSYFQKNSYKKYSNTDDFRISKFNFFNSIAPRQTNIKTFQYTLDRIINRINQNSLLKLELWNDNIVSKRIKTILPADDKPKPKKKKINPDQIYLDIAKMFKRDNLYRKEIQMFDKYSSEIENQTELIKYIKEKKTWQHVFTVCEPLIKQYIENEKLRKQRILNNSIERKKVSLQERKTKLENQKTDNIIQELKNSGSYQELFIRSKALLPKFMRRKIFIESKILEIYNE